MKKSRNYIIALLSLMMFLSASLIASAQSGTRRSRVLSIGGQNQRESYYGRGRHVLISGESNRIKLLGNATTVRVTGNNNLIRLGVVRQIEVAGTGNHITYTKAPGGGTPRIFQRSGNVVGKGK